MPGRGMEEQNTIGALPLLSFFVPLGWSCCQQDVFQPAHLVLTSLLCAGLQES